MPAKCNRPLDYTIDPYEPALLTFYKVTNMFCGLEREKQTRVNFQKGLGWGVSGN